MSWLLWFLVAMGAGQTGAAFCLDGSVRTGRYMILLAYVALGIGLWKLWHWHP